MRILHPKGKLASGNGRGLPAGGKLGNNAPMNSMHEFVIRGGQTVTAGQMEEFKRKLPFVKAKLATIPAPDFPHLKAQADFLVRYAEDVLEGIYACSDLPAIAETIFALNYLFKDVDIIPDSVPGKGMADDSQVVRTVLASHAEEFKAFAVKTAIGLVSFEA